MIVNDLRRSAEEVKTKSNSSLENEPSDEPQNPTHVDRIEEAKTNETVETYNARKEIRKSVGRIGVALIYAAGIAAMVIMAVYLCCLVASPFYPQALEIEKNFEPLFDKIVHTAPWVLLFIFGDARKLSKLIGNNNE
ncbi:hypothetical protein [Hydrogenimonas sp.]